MCSRNSEKIVFKQAIEQFVLDRIAHHRCNNTKLIEAQLLQREYASAVITPLTSKLLINVAVFGTNRNSACDFLILLVNNSK